MDEKEINTQNAEAQQVDEFKDEVNEIKKVFALSRDEWSERQLGV